MSIGSSVVTTGRGGAGNIGSSQLKPADRHHAVLQTPTLKGAMYTTGRGGSGNMAKNDQGAEARKAQDVEPVLRADKAAVAQVSTGRGGGGNMYKSRDSNSPPAARGRDKPRQGSGVSEIARDVLQKIRSHSTRRKSPSLSSARSSLSLEHGGKGGQ